MKKNITVKKVKSAKVARRKPLTNRSGQVRELKSEDISAMQPAIEVLPENLLAVLPKRKRGERGLQKEPKKILLTLRYSPEVVDYFKSTGHGWQIFIDNVLKEYIHHHPKFSKSKKHQHL